MTGVDTWLLGGVLLTLGVSFGNWRAWAWLGASAASYVLSTVWWRSGLPYPSFIGGMADALICLGVYFVGKYRWEMWVWRLFQVSVLVNIVYLGGTLGAWASLPHNAYAVMLEAVNWLALLWIGGNGAVQAIGAAHADPAAHSLVGRLRGIVRPLYRERTQPAFHKAHH